MASMLDCKKIQARLGEYVDGALPSDQTWDVKLHLASCAVCDQAARELSGTVALLQSLPRQDTPAGFEQALARRLADVALQPRCLSLSERARAWWTPRAILHGRPAVLATAGTLAALVPAAVAALLFANQGGGATRPDFVPVAPTPLVASASKPGADFVQQCLDEHSTYAAADPLGDQTSVILASTTAASGSGTAPDSAEEIW